MLCNVKLFALAGLTVGVLIAVFGYAPAGAQPPCAAPGATLDADRHCRIHDRTAEYVLDLSYPVDYPELPPVADYLVRVHDGFVRFAQSAPRHDWPYTLTSEATSYRSGGGGGTQSVVLELNQDASPRPVTWYKSFNYDLGTRADINLADLFKPGTNVLDVVYPAVRRQLEKRWQPEVLTSMLGQVEAAAFQNFALTDDSVIFFIGQGQLLGHPEGPLQVQVPRTELAPVLA